MQSDRSESKGGGRLFTPVSWEKVIAGVGHDHATGIAIGPAGNTYFTGAIEFPAEIFVARLASGEVLTSAQAILAFASLAPAQSNPFNPRTMLRFSLSAAAEFELAVFDMGGRRARTLLATAPLGAGEHGAEWGGRDESGRALPSGVYFSRLLAGGEVHGGKMSLLK